MKCFAMSDGPTGRNQEGEADSTPASISADPLLPPGQASSSRTGAAPLGERALFPRDAAAALSPDSSETEPVAPTAPPAPLLPATLSPEPATPANRTRALWRAVRRFLWMDERLAQARHAGFVPGQPGWDFFVFGRSGLSYAGQLGESTGGQISALLLYRDACALFMRAQLARAGIDPSGIAHQECWRRLVALPMGASLDAGLTPAQRQLVTGALSAQGEGFLAEQPEDQRPEAMRTLTALAHGLGHSLESDAKRTRRVLRSRWLRISVTSLLVLTACWKVMAKLADSPNLALHRPVTVVTQHSLFGRDTSLLVDGDHTNLGFHTLEGPNQTATIDLGGVHRVSRVVVYNRSDCCQERAVPLRIEVSEDGKSFRAVADRTQTFDRWIAKFSSTRARYVRLTYLGKTAFHLSEVEVY
jgi:hypothetical protein